MSVASEDIRADHAGGIQQQLVPIAAAYCHSPVVATVRHQANAAQRTSTEESHDGR